MAVRQLKEYWMTIQMQVEAHDAEEVLEIFRETQRCAQKDNPYNIIGFELSDIEEV